MWKSIQTVTCICRSDCGVRCGNLYMSYKSIFQDIRNSMDWVHFHVSHFIVCLSNCLIIPPLVERGLYCNYHVRPSVHTFVTDISASTGRNDFIFDIWLWHGDLYRVSSFQVYRISTSCLPCDL